MPTVTELTELTLSEERRKWFVSAFGSAFFGSTMDRPCRLTAGKLMYAGIKDPLYGSGWGPPRLKNGQTVNISSALVATPWAVNVRAKARLRQVPLSNPAEYYIEVTIPGSGYTGTPTFVIENAGWTGWNFTVNMTGGRVSSITINTLGTGFVVGDAIQFASPTGVLDAENIQVEEFDNGVFMPAPETAEPGDAPVMKGTVQVCEVWYKEITGERSLAGSATTEVDLGDVGWKLNIISNSYPPSTEKYVSHREFYVNFTGKVGAYFLAARIPLTDQADKALVNVASTQISRNRPLEDMRQTALFPAVRTAEFWRSRVWGAVLAPRSISGSVAFTEGSDIATGGPFLESDIYKGIVDPATNNIVAFIDRVISSSSVRIRLPNNTEEDNSWQSENQTITNPLLSGDEGMIFASPIYAGEAGGGITYGMLTWNALDSIKDESLYASGAKIGKIARAGEHLLVIYDRGVGVYQGNVSVNAPPDLRSFLSAENVGTFNPDSCWQTPDGIFWFQGNGRLWRSMGGQIVDASAEMGAAGFWRRTIEADTYAQNLYQTTYNPETNMALMVGVPKVGDASADLGKYAVVIAHDTRTVHGLRWPIQFKVAKCVRHDDGLWQYYGAAGRHLYKLLKPGLWTDSYFTLNEERHEAQPVAWYGTTGTDWFHGTVWPVAVRVTVETEASSGIDVTVACDLKKGNLISRTFTADQSVAISHADLNRLEWVPLKREGGFGVQWKYSGSTAQDFTLVQAVHALDHLAARGFEPTGQGQ